MQLTLGLTGEASGSAAIAGAFGFSGIGVAPRLASHRPGRIRAIGRLHDTSAQLLGFSFDVRPGAHADQPGGGSDEGMDTPKAPLIKSGSPRTRVLSGLWERGYAAATIAAFMGVSARTVRRLAAALQLPARDPSTLRAVRLTRWTLPQVQELVALWTKNFHHTSIARLLGKSPAAVASQACRIGLYTRKRSELSRELPPDLIERLPPVVAPVEPVAVEPVAVEPVAGEMPVAEEMAVAEEVAPGVPAAAPAAADPAPEAVASAASEPFGVRQGAKVRSAVGGITVFWTRERKQRLAELWFRDVHHATIAELMDSTAKAVASEAHRMGLPQRVRASLVRGLDAAVAPAAEVSSQSADPAAIASSAAPVAVSDTEGQSPVTASDDAGHKRARRAKTEPDAGAERTGRHPGDPAPRANSKAQMRRCLYTGEMFWSTGPGDRISPAARNSQRYQDALGGYAESEAACEL